MSDTQNPNINTNVFNKGLIFSIPLEYSGVYKITNIINGKCYIGSSLNLYNRLGVHKTSLKYNRHENEYLQKAYNKYGVQNFTIEILEKYKRIEDEDFRNFLLLREQIFFDRICNLSNQ